MEVKPGFRKEGRKKGRVLDWEGSCVVERRGRWGALSNSYTKIFNSVSKQMYYRHYNNNKLVINCHYCGYHLQNLAVGGGRGE